MKNSIRPAVAMLVSVQLYACASSSSNLYQGHGAESVSSDILDQFKPPRLPSEVSKKVQLALDTRAQGDVRISGDGKLLFFNWNVTGTPQVWKQEQAKSFPVQMTGGEESTQVLAITPDQKFIVIERDSKGQENPGLYLQSVHGGALMQIQHLPKVQTEFGFISDDSKKIYFTANDKAEDSYALYEFNIDNREKTLIFSDPGLWSIADHLRDQKILLAKATGALTREYFELDLKDRSLKPVLGQKELEDYEVEYGSRPGQFFVLTNKFSDFKRLYSYQDEKFTPVTPEIKWDVSHFSVDEPKKRVLYQVNEAGYTKLFNMDTSTLHPVEIREFKDVDHVKAGRTSRNGRFTPLTVYFPTSPKKTFIKDWWSGKSTEWFTPSAPEQELTKFTKVELSSYPAKDGTQIPVWIHRASVCDQPCPVIVIFHGGPEVQAQPLFSPILQVFLDEGFTVLEPNVRGSEGYGKSWTHADDGPKRLQVISDIEDASKFVKEKFSYNGKAPKVGIMGGSYGGYSTLMGMTYFAGAYDAGVAIVGMSNLVTFLKNTAPYRRALRVTEYGDPVKDAEALEKLSPLTHVSKLKGPLLIIQGASDPRVPVGESIQMYKAAAKRSEKSKLILFADEGHGAQKRENRVIEMGSALLFFKDNLK